MKERKKERKKKEKKMLLDMTYEALYTFDF